MTSTRRHFVQALGSAAALGALHPLSAFAHALDHPDIPACDLIVRTSGEQRLSDFMLWRSAYSEFLFLDKFWPEMTGDDVAAILEEYVNRQRRFGG